MAAPTLTQTLVQPLVKTVTRNLVQGSGSQGISNYLRPGGVFDYFRPDGTSYYVRQ